MKANTAFGRDCQRSEVHQDRPDERQVRGVVKNGTNHKGYRSSLVFGNYAMGVQPGAADHIFSYGLTERKRNVGASLKYDFTVMGNDQSVKFGYDFNNRDAAFMQYWLNVGHPAPEAVLPDGEEAFHSKLLLKDYYAPEWFAKGALVIHPWGYNPDGDGYNGKLDIRAPYLMGTFKFWNNRIVLSGGVRNEKAKFRSIGQRSETAKDTVTYNRSDWFPSLNLAFNVTKDVVLRASWNRTTARYDFRECFLVKYYDVGEKITVLGNDSLQNTKIQNYDFRAEWYPAPGEVLSLAYFIKKFKDPIEQYVYRDTPTTWAMQPRNLKTADGKGFEVNFRKNLGFIAPGTPVLKDLWLSGNAMFMDMKVNYTNESDSARTRPLQDLVPYSINASLSYEGDIFGAAVNYATTGRKLIRADEEEAGDQYEAPRHVLDFQLSARLLKKRMEIKFNISDIFAQPFIRYKNMGFKDNNQWGPKDVWQPYVDDMSYNRGKDWLIENSHRGANYSLSISYRF